MSKSNPTTRPDSPNYEVVGNMIHRYEPMTIQEAFGALSEHKEPLCGFRDADFQPWVKSRLHYVHPTAVEPFRTKAEKFQQCARIMVEDPRKVPEGVPELPEPWMAYVGKGVLPISSFGYWYYQDGSTRWNQNAGGGMIDTHYAIDVRTAFAREHFPEYVAAIGWSEPKAEPKPKTEAEAIMDAINAIPAVGTHTQIWERIFRAGREYERKASQ